MSSDIFVEEEEFLLNTTQLITIQVTGYQKAKAIYVAP